MLILFFPSCSILLLDFTIHAKRIELSLSISLQRTADVVPVAAVLTSVMRLLTKMWMNKNEHKKR